MMISHENLYKNRPKPLGRMIESDRQRPLPPYEGKWSLADSKKKKKRLGSMGMGT